MSAIDNVAVHAMPRPAGIFGRMAAALADWNNARVTRNALYNLSDRELLDIGLNRSEIERVARGL